MKRIPAILIFIILVGCLGNIRGENYLNWSKSDRQQWVNAYNQKYPDKRYNQNHAMLRGANGTVLRINNGPLPKARDMSTAEYLDIRGFTVLVYVSQSPTRQHERYYKIYRNKLKRVYPRRKRGTHFGRHPAFQKEYQEQKDNPGLYTEEDRQKLYK